MKINQPAQIETQIRGEIMAVKLPKELDPYSDSKDSYFFVDLIELQKAGITSLDYKALRSGGKFRRYTYAPEGFTDLTEKVAARDSYSFCNELDKFDGSALKAIGCPDFDPKKLFWVDTSCYMFYKFRAKDPTTRTYWVDYIGGITNEYYDLKKAGEILAANKWVSQIEKINIPHYNAERGKDRAIEFTVRLPQKEFLKLVHKLRDEDKEEFWTVRLKESFAPHWGRGVDPLGLKPAMKEASK